MEIVIREIEQTAGPVEIVERKGIGHPDTICDAVAEDISTALCRYYLEHFGFILHHNVDKILLCGGAARPAFGGGEITEPIEMYLAGRVTKEFNGHTIPADDLAVDACRTWFQRNLPALNVDRDLRVIPRFRQGSAALTSLFRNLGAKAAPSNDTSCGVGFAPFTALENAVLAIDAALTSSQAREAYPAIGPDVKVMGIRHGTNAHFTVACAMIDRHVRALGEYLDAKSAVREMARQAAQRFFDGPLDVSVNTADNPAAGDLYLTVTGTSAESGDDGQVGRGNRVCGLITPYRPMTLEAAAGKNPVNHVGKLYNLAAPALAWRICNFPQVLSATCTMVSQIGRPIDDPDIVDLGIQFARGHGAQGLTPELETGIRDELSALPKLQAALLAHEIRVY